MFFAEAKGTLLGKETFSRLNILPKNTSELYLFFIFVQGEGEREEDVWLSSQFLKLNMPCNGVILL